MRTKMGPGELGKSDARHWHSRATRPKSIKLGFYVCILGEGRLGTRFTMWLFRVFSVSLDVGYSTSFTF
jgi:hypothetical protein